MRQLLCLPVFLIGLANASLRADTLGSGFLISPDGYILTNNHVIAQAERIAVVVPGHESLDVSVVLTDPHKDLALLKLELSNLPYLPIADSGVVRVLDTVYVLGYPLAPELGSSVSASEGKINAVPDEGLVPFFQFDADINPGNSGGPVLNDKGEVVAVVDFKLDAIKMLKETGSVPERINFAIPIDESRQMVRRAYPLGFTPSAKTAMLSAQDLFEQARKATVLIVAQKG